MATSDRKPYESATVLDQAFLDDCHDNLVNQLELVVDIDAPIRVPYISPTLSLVDISWPAHGFTIGDLVQVYTSDFGSDFDYYTVTSASTDAFTFDAVLPPFPPSGELIFIGKLRLSDRNKYVGPTFYEARLNFPVISRTIGEFLNPTLEFSQLQLEVNNADGKFNNIMPAGEDYGSWIGRAVSVKMGLRDVASTYKEIFSGHVTDKGGFSRTVKSFSLIARNDFERINVDFPKAAFKITTYPNIEPEIENTIVPIVYGDWTVNVQPDGASIPAFPTNGNDVDVMGTSSFSTLIDLVISDNDNTFFDTSEVYVLRSQVYYKFDVADVVGVVNNRAFQLRQSGTSPAGTTLIDGAAYEFKRGDKFYVKVKGKALGGYDDNIVWQARDILFTYAEVAVGDFDTSWATYRDKAAPAESAISTFKSRAWIQEAQQTLTYALSMFEQVRLEAFIDRNLKLKIRSLHLDDFISSPPYAVRNWDVEAGSFAPKLDDRNNFNRVRGSFNFLPNRNENYQETPIFKNVVAIQHADKEISKRIVFPNLYESSVVADQVKEVLRIASSYIEVIEATLTWRSLLLDIGDFVKVNVSIQGTEFVNVPAMVREIGYDPAGIKIPVKMWSFQLMPFPGHAPGFSGITGGSDAAITEET